MCCFTKQSFKNCHNCNTDGTCPRWFFSIVSTVMGILLLVPGYYVVYRPTHDMETSQVVLYEQITSNTVTPYLCPKIEASVFEYDGDISCSDVIRNINSYTHGENIQCGAGPNSCAISHLENCTVAYNMYTSTNDIIINQIMQTQPGKFHGITDVYDCQAENYMVDDIKLNYKCKYQGYPYFQLTNSQMVTEFAVINPVHIYLQSSTVGCITKCDVSLLNQMNQVNIGTCTSLSLIVDIPEIDTYTSYKDDYICGYDDDACAQLHIDSIEKNLKKVYYIGSTGTYSSSKTEFNYRSAYTMFAFGAVSFIPVLLYLIAVLKYYITELFDTCKYAYRREVAERQQAAEKSAAILRRIQEVQLQQKQAIELQKVQDQQAIELQQKKSKEEQIRLEEWKQSVLHSQAISAENEHKRKQEQKIENDQRAMIQKMMDEITRLKQIVDDKYKMATESAPSVPSAPVIQEADPQHIRMHISDNDSDQENDSFIVLTPGTGVNSLYPSLSPQSNNGLSLVSPSMVIASPSVMHINQIMPSAPPAE
jgi:hypothetical protein